MTQYQRKTVDCWRMYVNYGYGWEHELTEYSKTEINDRKREYAENCPQYPVRVVKGRERKEWLALTPHQPRRENLK